MALTTASVVEVEFTAGVWTDVSRDVQARSVDYGIKGGGPNDRFASSGTGRFTLDNSENNSAGLKGYYSPGHVNCRANFDLNIRIRWRTPPVDDGAFAAGIFARGIFAVGTSARTWAIHKISSITPTVGQYGERRTYVESLDWVDTLAEVNTSAGLQLNKRTDEIATAIFDAMTTQPESRSIATGNSTFTYALDNVKDEKTRALSALSALVQSEGSYGYVKGDGTAVIESRLGRAALESMVTLDGTMHDLRVSRAREDIFNRFQVIVHPRRVDAAATTVLYTLRTRPAISPGQTLTFSTPYGDPNNGDARCGGTDMVVPVAGTDYSFYGNIFGTGPDLTANLTVSVVFSGNSAAWTITNNGATSGYLVKPGGLDGLQCRGRGIYDTQPLPLIAEDAASIAQYGERPCTVDMPFQEDMAVGAGFAEFLLNLYLSPTSRAQSVSFVANDSDDLMAAAHMCEIGTKITLSEAQTGVDAEFFIHNVVASVEEDILRITWGLAPADMNSYWKLGVVNAGELGLTTRLGFA